MLSLTVIATPLSTRLPPNIRTETPDVGGSWNAHPVAHDEDENGGDGREREGGGGDGNGGGGGEMERHDRDATITQSIPVIVLANDTVSLIHEPRCRDPDVYITLPPLSQLKPISDRFTKLALSTTSSPSFPISTSATSFPPSSAPSSSRLHLSANMRGHFRLSVTTAALSISSHWRGLDNPRLDPAQVEGGEEAVGMLASERMRSAAAAGAGDDGGGDGEGWAKVRVEGRDWGRVLGVGRLGGRVIACGFC